MSFDTVCWSITGASTPAALGRVLANIASQNTQGINLPGDLKVTQLGSPGGGVQIAAGAAVIRNAQAAGETYVGKASSPTTVSIPPTGGSARSDLVVAYVIDPDFAPWSPYTTPTQILNGPYFLPGVLPGVASSTTAASQVVSYSAVELARIDIPASTSVITNAMIHDLRGLARPRTQRSLSIQPGASDLQELPVTQTTYAQFPSNTFTLTVPSWATTADVIMGFQFLVSSNPVNSNNQIVFGSLTGSTQFFDYNGSQAAFGAEMYAFSNYAQFNVASLQGQTITVTHQAERTFTGGSTGNLEYNTGQQVSLDVQFSERTV